MAASSSGITAATIGICEGLVLHADVYQADRINAQGTAVLLVEQNAHAALKLAKRGYVLEMGRIVLEGEGLVDSPQVREAYLGGAADG